MTTRNEYEELYLRSGRILGDAIELTDSIRDIAMDMSLISGKDAHIYIAQRIFASTIDDLFRLRISISDAAAKLLDGMEEQQDTNSQNGQS